MVQKCGIKEGNDKVDWQHVNNRDLSEEYGEALSLLLHFSVN
jgi:hypothetical protein